MRGEEQGAGVEEERWGRGKILERERKREGRRDEERGEKLANFSHPVWAGLAFQGASLDSRFSSLVLGPPRDETRTLLLLLRARVLVLLLLLLSSDDGVEEREREREVWAELFSLSRCRGGQSRFIRRAN